MELSELWNVGLHYLLPVIDWLQWSGRSVTDGPTPAGLMEIQRILAKLPRFNVREIGPVYVREIYSVYVWKNDPVYVRKNDPVYVREIDPVLRLTYWPSLCS